MKQQSLLFLLVWITYIGKREPENMSDNRSNSIVCFEASEHPIKFMHLCTASPCRHLNAKRSNTPINQTSNTNKQTKWQNNKANGLITKLRNQTKSLNIISVLNVTYKANSDIQSETDYSSPKIDYSTSKWSNPQRKVWNFNNQKHKRCLLWSQSLYVINNNTKYTTN